MDSHPHYNKANFPHFVQDDGPWHIYRNDAGKCAAIAVKEGHSSSHFGDMAHVEKINRQRLAYRNGVA